MKIVRVFLITVGLLMGWVSAFGQTSVNHNYNTGQVTYTLNSGPDTAYFNYYDVGGPAGLYYNSGNAANSVVTFVSAPGTTIDVTFSPLSIEEWWDALYIFDGTSTAATQISSGNGPSFCSGVPGAWWGTGLPGNAGPGLVRSTGNSITFAFCTDGSVVRPGWAAVVRTTQALVLTKTVGTTPGVCAPTSSISVDSGTTVYYCYTVTNVGTTTASTHSLVDDQLGTIFSGLNHTLAPGASIDTVTLGLSVPVVISTTTTNTATWTSGSLSASASAAVTVPTYNVTAAVNDPLGGSASCDPASVLSGSSSTCTASANAGYVFTSWAGDCSGTDPVCTLSGITSDKLSTANFAQAFNVAVSVDDPASGSVTCEPPTVPSGGSSVCTATPSMGYLFNSWSGDCSGTNPVCILENVTADRTVAASFRRAAAEIQAVPTLEAWGLMLLSGLLGWLAWRRRAA
ncbi:IPTL-CTERM sorting domain-containing protein [Ottowia caeni]|uniref:IPTL-CTERM sorting domain-containing protein n=1 Tax=Ottowia caeni TaxID=2870339 RepID=UPI003D740DF8